MTDTTGTVSLGDYGAELGNIELLGLAEYESVAANTSPKFIQGKLIAKLSQLSKGLLWEYPNGNPAVLKSNAFRGKTPPSPKMPYMAVDFLQTLNPFFHTKYEGWINNEEYVVLESKVMQFNVTVYGSGEDDTLYIASQVSTALKAAYNRDYFQQFEVGLYDISRPTVGNLRLADEYRDASSFTISLSYVERVIDGTGGGVISSMEVNSIVGNVDSNIDM